MADEGKRLREMFEQAPGMMVLLSGPEHAFEFANRTYLEFVGTREITGKPVREALPELEGQGFVRLLDEVYSTGEPFVGRQMPVVLQRRRDAPPETRYFDFVYQPIRNSQRGVTGIFGEGFDVTEHVQSEMALRESEARFRLFSEETREGVVIHDGQTIIDCNAAFARMFGYDTVEELIGVAITDTIAPESIPKARQMMADRAEAPFEVTSCRKDGTTLPCEIVARETTWRGKRVRIVVARDLTATRRHEAELRESEAHLSAMFNQAAAGISETDLTGRFLRVNDRYCEIVGRTRDELLGGLRMQEITHPDDLPGNLILFQKSVEEGEPFEIEKRYIRPDSQIVWVNNSVNLIHDEVGKPRNIVAVTIDVTARRKAEEALRQSEERLATALQIAALGTFEWDLRDNTVMASARTRSIYGFAEDEGSNAEDYFTRIVPEDVERVREEVAATLRGSGHLDSEYRIKLPDGAIRHVVSLSQLYRDAQGQPERQIGVFDDITEQKRWEEHQRLLIAELNHRVKNTLATVQSIASQTFKGEHQSNGTRQAFEGRLFALAKAHDVLTRENWEGAELGEIVTEAMNPYRRGGAERIQVKGPKVRLEPRAALAIAMALHELATNAAKYGALSVPSGRVSIEWSVTRGKPRHLTLRWEERNGPPVSPPKQMGFGTRLIQRSLALDLGGEVDLTYEPTGLVCVVTAPLGRDQS
jgi:PAS domain S-box-containing protein